MLPTSLMSFFFAPSPNWNLKVNFEIVCFGVWELLVIFWTCASPYKSRCQKWTQAHLYRGRYDRHSFGVFVSKQNVKSFENITQSFQSDQDGRARGNFAKCSLGIKSRRESTLTDQNLGWICRRKSCSHYDRSLGKEGSKLTQGLFTILWSELSTRWRGVVFWGPYFYTHFDMLLKHIFMTWNFLVET